LKTPLSYRFFIFIFLMCAPYLSSGQAEKERKTNSSQPVGDTAGVHRLLKLGRSFFDKGQLDETLIYVKQAYALSKKINYKSGLVRSDNMQGRVYYQKGNFPEALACLNAALLLSEELNDSVLQSGSINGLGNTYAYMGNHVKAVEYYMKGVAIEEKIKIQKNLHWYYNNIGAIYNDQHNYQKALEYLFKAVSVEKKIKDDRALSVTFMNMGNSYSYLDKKDSALYYFNGSLRIAEEVEDTVSIAQDLANSAILYCQLKRYGAAYESASKGYKLASEKGYNDIIMLCLISLGEVAQVQKKYGRAENYFLEMRDLAKKTQAKTLMKDAYLELSGLYYEKKDYEAAYKNYQLFSETKDTILNQENSKLITEMNTKYTSEKKEKEIELLKKNEEIQNLELVKKKNELDRQRTVSISVFAGFLLLMIVAILTFSRYRLKKKANDQLQSAFNLIEEKNTQIEKSNLMITDSITYAKRIQDAILPAPEDLAKVLSDDFFIFYQPAHIVSGDFYWCSQQQNKTIFVVADCTGHGVPGAFMSMIGNTLLNEIVNERKVTDTQKIAELLDEKIIHSLHQHAGTDKYDGMDISICCIDKTSKEISFTGAHHAMYAYNEHLQKIKGDPYSIGGAQQQKNKTFTSQSIHYEKGLRLYFLTDGYCDQSGGEASKRFSSKKFELLLAEIQDVAMNDQKEKLELAMESWKGSTKQRDDILVVGIKC
jgi:serine phosphatase RsbU (regulator of sigma subunit)